MQKKIVLILLGFFILLTSPSIAYGVDNLYGFPTTPPISCNGDPNGGPSCPVELIDAYAALNEPCAASYTEFLAAPATSHYWVEDPEITAQGKADDRARQFLYWVINTSAIDEAPVLRDVWNVSSLIALFGVVLIAAIFGIGYIISQRTQYNFNIRIWPTVVKIGVMLLYIAFSAAIVFILIQLSEVLMKFFYENLGGRDLFNIYFNTPTTTDLIGQTEQNYKGFIGCRDLNIRVTEGIHAELFLLKLTNVTYYVMGTMLLLRKILLWFLLFVSPFLALLMPFVFIRNTGWIWIGVFFQWLFYGPLLTLFLGAMARIWRDGIPWSFDFSRVSSPGGFDLAGYVYPTGINIVYGGPAQRLQGLFNRPIGAANNGNYIDTFAEYVITLIMLWAVTFFPWWLLRIFRDYCCEGIYAMKNILLAMYNNMQNAPSPKGPTPPPKGPTLPSLKLDTKTPTNTNLNVSIASFDRVRTMATTDISRTLNLQANRITDIARVETNTQTQQTINQNLTNLSNPVKATTPAERQQYMNLRTELFNRAIKSDSVARTILASTSTSQVERTKVYKEILKSIPVTTNVTVEQAVATETKQSQTTIKNVTNSYTKSISMNTSVVNSIAKTTNTKNENVKKILNSYANHTSEPITTIIKTVARETNTSENTVRSVLSQSGAITAQARIIAETTEKQKLTKEQTTKILDSMKETVTTAKTSSMLERVSEKTQLPPANVENFITSIYNSVSSNEQTVQQIAGNSGTPPADVKKILNTYATKITTTTDSPQTIINETAKELNIETTNVEQTIQNTNSYLQNSTAIEQTAQEQNITKVQGESIIQTISAPETVSKDEYVTTIEQFAAKDETPAVTDTTVQNIVESMASNENLVSHVSENTNVANTDVKNVLYSYAQNLATETSNITNTISKQTGIEEKNVQSVLQNVSTTVTNTPSVAQSVSESIKVDQPTVQKVVNAIPATIQTTSSSPVITTIAQQTSAVNETSLHNMFTTIASQENLMQQVSEQSHVETSVIKNLLQVFEQNLHQTTNSIVENITKSTNLSTQQIQQVMQSLSETIQSSTEVKQSLVQSTNLTEKTIENVTNALPDMVKVEVKTDEKEAVSKTIANNSNVSEATTTNAVKNIMNSFIKNESMMNSLTQETGLKSQQIENIVNTYTQNMDQPATTIIAKISESSGIQKENVRNTLQTLSNAMSTSDTVINEIAKQENMKTEDVTNVLQNQMQLAAEPEKHIEKTITIPQSVSLEDYEEVKKMWMNHYEEGDVPVSDNITTRSEWIEQDIVFITNTLNKLLSTDEKLREEGLDELGFLLPIFLINNLKGEELIVYLKAKLEAAKSIQQLLEREQKVREKIKAEEEDENTKLEVKRSTVEKNDKHMMLDENEENEEKAPQSIEDRVKAVQEKLSSIEEDAPGPNIDGIREKLQSEAEKKEIN